jgi:hypothetical protein
MQDTLSEGIARAAQLAPSAITASAVGRRICHQNLQKCGWLPTLCLSLSDDQRLLYAVRSRVLLDERILVITEAGPGAEAGAGIALS